MYVRNFTFWLSVSLLCIAILRPFAAEGQFTPDDTTQLIPHLSFTSEVAVEAVVDSSRVPLNRNLTLTIKASCAGDINQLEFQWPNPPDIDRFDIVGSSSANVVTDDGSQRVTVKEFRYILKPVGEGQGRIGPVTLFYRDKIGQKDYSLSTRALSIEITEPLAPGPEGIPATLYLLIGLGVIILAGVSLASLRKMRGKKEEAIPEIETKSPEEMALEELESVPKLRLAGETKEYYSAISTILRRYIDRTFALRTSELTTPDIISNLQLKKVEDEAIIEIENILKTCDMVKFARHEPATTDMDRILSLAQDFFTERIQVSSGDVKEEEKEGIDS